MAFRRLSERHGTRQPEEALCEGLPRWLLPSAAQYLWSEIAAANDAYYPTQRPDLVASVERKLRLEFDWSSTRSAERSLVETLNDPELGLDVLDCVLQSGSVTRWDSAQWLGRAFEESGSAWTVGTTSGDVPCLQRRVDPTVQQSAERVMSRRASSASHLRSAWQEIYGRDPNPSNAYREAVRAVEAAGSSAIIPNDGVATLGKMISAVKDAPTKWTMRFTDPGSADPIEVVLEMMQLLWGSQFDRHGRSDDSPVNVTQHEAEDALHLAVTLVAWFESGAIARRSD